jgi:hypothetical protein
VRVSAYLWVLGQAAPNRGALPAEYCGGGFDIKWTSQDSVDTSASSSGSFKFLRTHAAQMTMAARWIVERFNVVRYFGLRKLASSVDLLFDAFLLEAAKE